MKYLKEFDAFDMSTSVSLESDDVEEKDAGKAMDRLLKKGIMPDGNKWMDIPKMKWGFDNEIDIRKPKQTESEDAVTYTATLRLAPGEGGGGGIGIDSRATNQFYDMMGTERSTLKESMTAYTSFAKQNSRKLNSVLERWLRVPDNFLWRISGWENRSNYTVSDVMFKGVVYEDAVVDPTRRKWPAGRTEAWVPVMVDLVMKLKKKSIKEDIDLLNESELSRSGSELWKMGNYISSIYNKFSRNKDREVRTKFMAETKRRGTFAWAILIGMSSTRNPNISEDDLSDALSILKEKHMKESIDGDTVRVDVKNKEVYYVWPDPSGKAQAALMTLGGKRIFGLSYRCGPNCSKPQFWRDNFDGLARHLKKMSEEEFKEYISFRANGPSEKDMVFH